MKQSTIVFGVLISTSIILSSCGNMKTEEQNKTDIYVSNETIRQTEQQLLAANDSLYAALNAMFTGNLEPMNALWSHSEKITDMGPFGGRLTGWKAVSEEFQKEAAMKLGGTIACKDVHVFAGTNLGYTVCIEEGENMSADGKPVKVSHRATNVFHLENGQWKLVHHQTDLSPQLEAAIAGR